jgi:hypothetical protein
MLDHLERRLRQGAETWSLEAGVADQRTTRGIGWAFERSSLKRGLVPWLVSNREDGAGTTDAANKRGGEGETTP